MDPREFRKDTSPGIEGPAGSAPAGACGGAGTDGRPGPTWRGWVISIFVAVILSVAATVILGGPFTWRASSAAPSAPCGGPCCPPAGR